MRWAALSEDTVLYGYGGSIYAVTRDVQLTSGLLAQAEQVYRASAYMQHHTVQADFAPLWAGLLAARQSYPPAPQVFADVLQVLRALAAFESPQAILRVHNAMQLGELTGDDTAMLLAIAEGFTQGQLLREGQDEARLAEPATLLPLPGVLRYFLGVHTSGPRMLPSFARLLRQERALMEQRP